MKETIEKMFSLGLGVVAASKEQIEKTVEELVAKGELNKAESKDLIDRLVKKGEEARQQAASMIQGARGHTGADESRWATREDIARIEQRLDALEQKDRKDE